MTKKYLSNTDPEAFRGLEKKAKKWFDSRVPEEDLVPCHKCNGYGGWILERDAYPPKTGDPDGPRQHFKCSCDGCNGWGYYPKDMEPLDVKRQRIFDTFKPVIERISRDRGYNKYVGCFLLKDKSLKDHPDLRAAMIYAADGWWSHNFGGGCNFVEEVEEGLIYRAYVYTD